MLFRKKKASDASMKKASDESIPTTVALSPDTSDEDDNNVDHSPLQSACKLTIQAAIRKRDRLGIVRIKVPDYSSERQVSASIICVIDISSSNDDQSRVHIIKHATKKVIKTLGPKDQVAIITYADDAEVVLVPES
jgi:Mg-chelatase subunit ChlD